MVDSTIRSIKSYVPIPGEIRKTKNEYQYYEEELERFNENIFQNFKNIFSSNDADDDDNFNNK